MNIAEKFEKLGVDNAPGQEVHRKDEDLPTRENRCPARR
jgi:hypothetical protein